MKMKRLAAFSLAALAAALPALAVEEFAFVYRGRITAQSGTVPEELEVRYALYRGENDQTAVWSQTKVERPGANGVFQSVLSGDGLKAAFLDAKARYLGVTLGTNGVERTPRQEVVAAPLAAYAERVAEAPSGTRFVEASAKAVRAGTLSAGSLAVTEALDLGGRADLSFGTVSTGAGASIKVAKPLDGHVALFGRTAVAAIEGDRDLLALVPQPSRPGGFATYVPRTPVLRDRSTCEVPFAVTFPIPDGRRWQLPPGVVADSGTLFFTYYSGN